jgi:hypothetical protein
VPETALRRQKRAEGLSGVLITDVMVNTHRNDYSCIRHHLSLGVRIYFDSIIASFFDSLYASITNPI